MMSKCNISMNQPIISYTKKTHKLHERLSRTRTQTLNSTRDVENMITPANALDVRTSDCTQINKTEKKARRYLVGPPSSENPLYIFITHKYPECVVFFPLPP